MSRPTEKGYLARSHYYGRVATHRDVAGLGLTEMYHTRPVLVPEHTHGCPYIWLVIAGAYREHVGSKERPHRPFSFGYCPVGFEHRDEIGRVGARFFAIEFDAHGAQMIADLNRPLSATAAEIHDTGAFGSLLQLYSEFLRARDGRYDVDPLS